MEIYNESGQSAKLQQTNPLGMYMTNNSGNHYNIGNNIQNKSQLYKFIGREVSNNDSMLEDNSFVKSMKKKNPKKVTPKNVVANSNFSWMM